jgi:hypothetical protein
MHVNASTKEAIADEDNHVARAIPKADASRMAQTD